LCLLLLCKTCGAAENSAGELEAIPAVPQSQKITLDQAMQTAFQKNPLVQIAQHQVAGAKDNLYGQSKPLNPTISYAGVNNTVVTNDFGSSANYSVQATVETSGRLGLRTRQARAQLNATEADADTSRQTLRQSVASAYIDLQVADSALANEQSSYDTAQKLSDLTEKQFKLGAAPETNAIRAQVAVTQEEQNLIGAINTVRVARANLNIQMGLAPDEPVDAADPLDVTPVEINLKTLQEQSLQSRPEIRSAEANTNALKAAVGLERSQYYPDVIVAGALDGTVGVGLSMPLFDFGGIRGSIGQAKEAVKAQEAQTEQVRQSVLLDDQTAYLSLIQAQKTLETFRSGILPRTESLLNKVEQGYALGASTILDLIDAQQTYRSVRNDYYAALGDYRRALAQIERAAGSPISTLTNRGTENGH
jgi:cobalt-zinc-cadmium efflux system outer membrane protein